MTVTEVVDLHIKGMEDSAGRGYAYQFSMACSDRFGEEVVEAFDNNGYKAAGYRDWIKCPCDECRGKSWPGNFVVVVHRICI